MKRWWMLYVKLPWDRRVLIGAGALALIPALLVYFQGPSPAPSNEGHEPVEISTHIPKGMVLVPIEVQNYEALDSILGPYGIVDLFQGGSDTHQKLVMRNVRLLRAPRNPSHFAVLIGEADVADLLRSGGAFTVIVKRPNEGGTEIVKEESRPRRSITYDGG